MKSVIAVCAVAVTLGCERSDRLPRSASAAREFREIGDVQLLPAKPAVETADAPLVPDSKIEWNVRQLLADAGIAADVAVDEQVVTLRGNLPAAQAENAQALAKGVQGVAGVRNELTVSP